MSSRGVGQGEDLSSREWRVAERKARERERTCLRAGGVWPGERKRERDRGRGRGRWGEGGSPLLARVEGVGRHGGVLEREEPRDVPAHPANARSHMNLNQNSLAVKFTTRIL